jgi:hypothetical protein
MNQQLDELLEGTVTFLFTDIVGSPQLLRSWEPTAMDICLCEDFNLPKAGIFYILLSTSYGY